MLCEAFGRLIAFAPLSRYSYVGFGSTYFSDFSLVHRSLGLRDMVSIEKDKEKKSRFLYNRPFTCIKLRFETSSYALPLLGWTKRRILWLDYDGKLDRNVLADVAIVCSRVRSGSVLVISVNAMPDKLDDRVRLFEDRVGLYKLPAGTSEQTLAGWGTAAISRTLVVNEIEEALARRNADAPEERKLKFHQLFHFRYSDGAKMLTTGGVFVSQAERDNLVQCHFGTLDFIRPGEESYQIEVPNLTFREMHHLNRQLPTTEKKTLKAKSIPADDLLKYRRIYRYFPRFAEAEF